MIDSINRLYDIDYKILPMLNIINFITHINMNCVHCEFESLLTHCFGVLIPSTIDQKCPQLYRYLYL